jgi:RNA polymerase sigma factor (sigma-70 family)
MSFAPYVTSRSPACSEHELVAAARAGDDEAFGELYSRYGTRIRTYVNGMVGDHQRAEDIAQEVFISALRRLRSTEQAITFKPWIYEIAKNACIDEHRRSQRLREVPLGDDADEAPALCSRAAQPHEAMQSKQRLDDLRGAFHSLSADHHKVIVMRELEGLSYAQIGDRMGMSKPMVESTLFRARRRLGEEYDELVSGRRCEHVQTIIASGGERPLRRLGIRERRQLARHLSHCQPCRRRARLAGLDDSFFTVPSVAKKLAALLPFPWLRLPGGRGRSMRRLADASRRVAYNERVRTSMGMTGAGTGAPGLGRALATAGAVVAAVAGGGYAAGLGGNHHAPRTLPGSSVIPAAKIVRAKHPASAVPTPSRRVSAGVRPSAHRGRRATAATKKPGASGPGASSSRGQPTAGQSGQIGAGGPGSVVSRASGAPAKTVGSAQSTLSGTVSKAGGTASKTVSGAAGVVSKTTGSVSQLTNSVTSKVAPPVGSVTSTVTNPVNKIVSQLGSAATSPPSAPAPVQKVANVVTKLIP